MGLVMQTLSHASDIPSLIIGPILIMGRVMLVVFRNRVREFIVKGERRIFGVRFAAFVEGM